MTQVYLLALSVLTFSVGFYLAGPVLRRGSIKYAVLGILFVAGVALLAFALDSWSVFLVSIISATMTLALRQRYIKSIHHE